MTNRPHQIKRQVLEFTIGDEQRARTMQDTLGDLCRKQISPMLDQICEKYNRAGQTIRIEKLELDLGKVNFDNLAASLPLLIGNLFEEELSKRVMQLNHDYAIPMYQDELIAEAQADLEAWRYFLQLGTWPWRHVHSSVDFSELTLTLLSKQPKQLVEALKNDLRDQRAVNRLAYQLDQKVFWQVLKALAPANHDGWQRLMEDFKVVQHRFPFSALNPRRFQNRLQQGLIIAAIHRITTDKLIPLLTAQLASSLASVDQRAIQQIQNRLHESLTKLNKTGNGFTSEVLIKWYQKLSNEATAKALETDLTTEQTIESEQEIAEITAVDNRYQEEQSPDATLPESSLADPVEPNSSEASFAAVEAQPENDLPGSYDTVQQENQAEVSQETTSEAAVTNDKQRPESGLESAAGSEEENTAIVAGDQSDPALPIDQQPIQDHSDSAEAGTKTALDATETKAVTVSADANLIEKPPKQDPEESLSEYAQQSLEEDDFADREGSLEEAIARSEDHNEPFVDEDEESPERTNEALTQSGDPDEIQPVRQLDEHLTADQEIKLKTKDKAETPAPLTEEVTRAVQKDAGTAGDEERSKSAAQDADDQPVSMADQESQSSKEVSHSAQPDDQLAEQNRVTDDPVEEASVPSQQATDQVSSTDQPTTGRPSDVIRDENRLAEDAQRKAAEDAIAQQQALRKKRNEARAGGDQSGRESIPSDSKLAPSIPWRLPTSALKEVYIDNSGLVLIWPFLSTLFKGMNWVEGETFKSMEDQHRAACYLQYLITGEPVFEEEKMVLNKLLAGLVVEEAIDTDITLTEAEKEEADHLLQVVIQNWTVLKGTSVQGLRDTFLRREGLLKKEFNGWKLFVQRTTMDVLLEKLPWSYAVIKLPWLDDMIYVEW